MLYLNQMVLRAPMWSLTCLSASLGSLSLLQLTLNFEDAYIISGTSHWGLDLLWWTLGSPNGLQILV